MRPSWRRLEPSWGPLGPSWAPFGPSWSLLGASWSLLVATLGSLVAILRPPGPSGGRRAGIWVPFCIILDQIWIILGHFWHHFQHIPDPISDHKDCCVCMCACVCAVAFSRDFHYSKQRYHARNIHAIHAYTQSGEAECAERLNIYIYIPVEREGEIYIDVYPRRPIFL